MPLRLQVELRLLFVTEAPHREKQMPAWGRADTLRDEMRGWSHRGSVPMPAFAQPRLTHVARTRHPLPLTVSVAS